MITKQFLFYFPLTKAQKTIEAYLNDIQNINYLNAGEEHKEPITTGKGGSAEVEIKRNPEAEHTDGEKLTGKEWYLFNCLISLYEQGVKAFTYSQLIKVMNGGRRSHHEPAEAEINRIEKQIELLSSFIIGINASRQNKENLQNLKARYNAKPIICFSITDENGRKRIKLTEEPLLLTYAKDNRQIAGRSLELLAGKERRKDQPTQAFRGLLAEKILEMMTEAKQKPEQRRKYYNHISVEWIIEKYLFCTDDGKPTIKRIYYSTDLTTSILADFTQKGYIKGFTRAETGKKGFIIELLESPQNSPLDGMK